MTFNRGDQVLYVPEHLKHLDWSDWSNWGYPYGLQPGFIFSKGLEPETYFVRYWSLGENVITSLINPELRTKANSELTHGRNLRLLVPLVRKEIIEELIKQIEGEKNSV